jgi:uncharacterized protein YbjT (DUF2867 family)
MILITGATGVVGREATRILLAAGQKVTAVTREPAAADLPEGATVAVGDPSRPRSLADVWAAGVEAILLSPRAVGDAAVELLAAAAEHGVRRVVVLSASTVQYPAGEPRFALGFKAVEDAARSCGLAWTFLRCADFDANALAWAPQVRAAGIVRGAYADAATSPIHQRDIAEVAALALTDPGHEGCSYLLTGPQSLNQRDKAALIGEAVGKPVSFTEIAPEQARAAMLAQGLAAEIPDRLLGSLADYARRPGPTSEVVQTLLGHPALPFAAWATENAAAFRN